MRSFDRRVCKLEAEIQARQPAWSADIEAVRARVVARIKVYIGETLAMGWHPAAKAAHEILCGDTPGGYPGAARCRPGHPAALTPDDGTWARIMAKLDEMAQRQEAQR